LHLKVEQFYLVAFKGRAIFLKSIYCKRKKWNE